jgi:hypothetical protein
MSDPNYLIKNILVDIIIITNIWGLIDDPEYKKIFGICMSTYILMKYV